LAYLKPIDPSRAGNARPTGNNAGRPITQPNAFPYLASKFLYRQDTVITPVAPVTPTPTAYPNPQPIPAGDPVGNPTGVPPVPPTGDTPQYDGWHAMLEYFEVPSSAFGSIAPIAQGNNLDWYRQDVKPGLLNLNVIIDEEVFFGLIDDPRLN